MPLTPSPKHISPVPGSTTSSKDRRLPDQLVGVNRVLALELLLLLLLLALLDHDIRQHNDVVILLLCKLSAETLHVHNTEIATYRIPEHVQILQRVQHISRRHGRRSANLLDTDLAASLHE